MHPIGIFDSGYGGLTVFKKIAERLPQYDYIYLGDNARNPYGPRSFQTVYEYTLECVQHLFDKGCRLVILACNTASAKALRNIQQLDLPKYGDNRRVLGVIRPTAEVVGNYSKTRKVGVLATHGTVISESYLLEIEHLFADIQVFQQACPMWVPLVENNEHRDAGADYFVRKNLQQLFSQAADIDTVILGCTHYPLLVPKIKPFLPPNVKLLEQGDIVADSLADYLVRHPEIEKTCAKNGQITFFSTETPENFDEKASLFFAQKVNSTQLHL